MVPVSAKIELLPIRGSVDTVDLPVCRVCTPRWAQRVRSRKVSCSSEKGLELTTYKVSQRWAELGSERRPLSISTYIMSD